MSARPPHRRRLSDAEVAEARQLRRRAPTRWTFAALGRRYGVPGATIYARLNPGARPGGETGSETRGCAGRRAAGIGLPPSKVRDAEAERLLRAIPADTRDLTGRLCGDPLPGRSALDRSADRQSAVGRRQSGEPMGEER